MCGALVIKFYSLIQIVFTGGKNREQMITFHSVASPRTGSFSYMFVELKMTTVPSALCNLADYTLG